MYKNRIIEELGDKQEALDNLFVIEPLVVDKLSLREKKVTLMLQLGKNVEAEQVCRELLAINSENYIYHK